MRWRKFAKSKGLDTTPRSRGFLFFYYKWGDRSEDIQHKQANAKWSGPTNQNKNKNNHCVCVYKHNNISKKTIEYNRLNNTRIIMAAMKISTFFLTMSILLQLSLAQGKNYVCSSCFLQISLNLSLIARMTPCETLRDLLNLNK